MKSQVLSSDQAWLDAGATSMEDRCRTETQRILGEHRADPISEDLDRVLDEIVASARKDQARA